jgi:hypothetical protein
MNLSRHIGRHVVCLLPEKYEDEGIKKNMVYLIEDTDGSYLLLEGIGPYVYANHFSLVTEVFTQRGSYA